MKQRLRHLPKNEKAESGETGEKIENSEWEKKGVGKKGVQPYSKQLGGGPTPWLREGRDHEKEESFRGKKTGFAPAKKAKWGRSFIVICALLAALRKWAGGGGGSKGLSCSTSGAEGDLKKARGGRGS